MLRSLKLEKRAGVESRTAPRNCIELFSGKGRSEASQSTKSERQMLTIAANGCISVLASLLHSPVRGDCDARIQED